MYVCNLCMCVCLWGCINACMCACVQARVVIPQDDYTKEEPIPLHLWCSQRCDYGFPLSVLPGHQPSLAAIFLTSLAPMDALDRALCGNRNSNASYHGVGSAEEGMCQPRGHSQAADSSLVLKSELRFQFFQCLPGGSSQQPPLNCAHLGPQIHLWALPCTRSVPAGLPPTDLTS